MREINRFRLNELLKNYRIKVTENLKQQERLKAEEELFLNEFKRLKDGIILPFMEEIKAELRAHGHDCDVCGEEESLLADGKIRDGRVSMFVFPEMHRLPDAHEYPWISFIASAHKRKVVIQRCTLRPGKGGVSGSVGEFMVSEVTADLVELKVLEMLDEIFARV